MRWFWPVTAALLASLVSGASSAQGRDGDAQRWLVLPAVGADLDGDSRTGLEALHVTSEAVRRDLSIRGESVWSADRASERFEVVGSAPAPEVSQSDIDRWVERSRAAVRYLAEADYKAARRELTAAQRLASRAAEELNREAARAQQVLDTCLFMVRAYVETGNDAEARRQARECRQLVPRIEPTAFRHTPEVRDLLDDVDREIAAEAPGTLRVTSDPPRCVVRVNGVELGRTPLDIELPVGTYRMQVECREGERGRIYRIDVGSGERILAFDGDLEEAVRSRPALHLRYDSPKSGARRMRHAGEVAGTLGAERVVVVSGVSERVARLDLSAPGYRPASAWLTVREGEPSSDDLRRAVDALLEGRSVDFSEAHPIARPSWQDDLATAVAAASTTEALTDAAKPLRSGAPRPRGQRIAGGSLLGAGVASIGASIGLHVHRGTLGDRFVAMPSSLSAAEEWRDARIGVWTTAAFGGVATSAAMPLLLPQYERTPWWAWTSGAFGLGLTAYAIYEGVTMTSCAEPFIVNRPRVSACVQRGQEAGRIALALGGAAPLLTMPLVYLFRPLRAEPSVTVSGTGAVFRVRGAF